MEPMHTNLSLQEIEAWGERIADEISRLSQLELGDQTVKVQAGSDLGKKIEELALELLSGYPRAANECVFIRTTYTVHPCIVVTFSDLEPILEEDVPGNLFRNEVGKKIAINNLAHEVFGNFIQQPTFLELRNIVFPQNGQFLKNEWTHEKVAEEANVNCINGSRQIGPVDIDPNFETTEINATVRFGDIVTENQTLTVKVRNRQNAQVIIPLPHLNMSAKIRYDGEVSLPNGKTFTMDQVITATKLVLVGSPLKTMLHFDIVVPNVEKK